MDIHSGMWQGVVNVKLVPSSAQCHHSEHLTMPQKRRSLHLLLEREPHIARNEPYYLGFHKLPVTCWWSVPIPTVMGRQQRMERGISQERLCLQQRFTLTPAEVTTI